MLFNKFSKIALARFFTLALVLVFLYMPIMTLIVYSFNESKMVTVWTGFSLKWYEALLHNDAIINAVGISLLIGFMTAITAVIIGTIAAFVIVRIKKFTGETAFLLFITAPMILPEVITGLALLLLFVTLSDVIPVFSDRGIITIWIAHVTFCSAYATVVIRSRFVELDVSIEEAAMDLGAGPMKVFFVIILPAIMPAEVAAFLLSFTLSMDDLVIASFVAGPDSTTMPMLIFSSVRRGLSPEINALASVIVLVVSFFAFIFWLTTVRKQRRKERNRQLVAMAKSNENKII
jgi:putrescine transport system permease protein